MWTRAVIHFFFLGDKFIFQFCYTINYAFHCLRTFVSHRLLILLLLMVLGARAVDNGAFPFGCAARGTWDAFGSDYGAMRPKQFELSAPFWTRTGLICRIRFRHSGTNICEFAGTIRWPAVRCLMRSSSMRKRTEHESHKTACNACVHVDAVFIRKFHATSLP